MVKMVFRYSAKYDIIKMKILTSAKEPQKGLMASGWIYLPYLLTKISKHSHSC